MKLCVGEREWINNLGDKLWHMTNAWLDGTSCPLDYGNEIKKKKL